LIVRDPFVRSSFQRTCPYPSRGFGFVFIVEARGDHHVIAFEIASGGLRLSNKTGGFIVTFRA